MTYRQDCCHLVDKLYPILCNPMDCSPPGFSIHGISQAGRLEWVAISFSRGGLPDAGAEPGSPALAGGFFTTEPSGKPSKTKQNKKNRML